jgi:hypothetical protein
MDTSGRGPLPGEHQNSAQDRPTNEISSSGLTADMPSPPFERGNYTRDTIRGYNHAVKQFCQGLRKSPEMMGSDEVREPTEMPNYHYAIASVAPAA